MRQGVQGRPSSSAGGRSYRDSYGSVTTCCTKVARIKREESQLVDQRQAQRSEIARIPAAHAAGSGRARRPAIGCEIQATFRVVRRQACARDCHCFLAFQLSECTREGQPSETASRATAPADADVEDDTKSGSLSSNRVLPLFHGQLS